MASAHFVQGRVVDSINWGEKNAICLEYRDPTQLTWRRRVLKQNTLMGTACTELVACSFKPRMGALLRIIWAVYRMRIRNVPTKLMVK